MLDLLLGLILLVLPTLNKLLFLLVVGFGFILFIILILSFVLLFYLPMSGLFTYFCNFYIIIPFMLLPLFLILFTSKLTLFMPKLPTLLSFLFLFDDGIPAVNALKLFYNYYICFCLYDILGFTYF